MVFVESAITNKIKSRTSRGRIRIMDIVSKTSETCNFMPLPSGGLAKRLRNLSKILLTRERERESE